MKKPVTVAIALSAALALSACGEEEATTKDVSSNTETSSESVAQTDDQQKEDVQAYTPEEPAKDEKCAFCNMEVYGHSHEMGAFTAQAVTESGERVYFDDSGCLLNYERQQDIEYVASWVRDYETNDWIEADEAVAIKSDIITPMKYGYAFFHHEEHAETFMAENNALNPATVTWDDIDAVAHERYKKKMESMNQSNMNHDDENIGSHHE